MGKSFQRNGSFNDRTRFMDTRREKLGKLRTGALAGMSEEWSEEGGNDIATLTGMGANIRFEVREKDWDCNVELPKLLPFPQSMVEKMFDDKMKDLEGL